VSISWPWTDVNDEVTCPRALDTLHREGVLVPRDHVWLGSALKQSVGLPGQWEIPWASWTLRICERIGVGEVEPTAPDRRDPLVNAAAGSLAIAVTALTVSARPPAIRTRDAAARWSLVSRVLGRLDGAQRSHGSWGSRAARDGARRAGAAPLADRIAPWLLGLGEYSGAVVPKNPPIPCRADEVGPGVPDLDAALFPRASPGVREAVALWTAPALIAGEDLAPWSRFGEAVAEPIAVLESLVRLWLDPGAGDLRDAALTALVGLWLDDPALRARVLVAFAGERESAARRFTIHSLLAGEAFGAALSRRVGPMIASARAALDGPLLASAGGDFLDALEERFRFFDELTTVRALLKGSAGAGGDPLRASGRDLRVDAEADLCMAVDFLRESAPWPRSWEVQRAGVFGSNDQPVGQWFVRGTILQALLEMGYDGHTEAAALLDEIPPGELRYYGTWRDIPPDADDLGLLLQLVSATGAAAERAETWIAVMLANVDGSGLVPTWFLRAADGSPTTVSGAAWAGDDCSAVRLNLLCGLLSFDSGRFDGLIQRNTARILEICGADGVGGFSLYDASYTALAFLRFARLYHDRAIDQSLAGAVASVAASIRARAAISQRFDGGWGSPQRTAACLEGAAAAAADPLLLERAMRYLGEHQLADGSWPAEPLYAIPMKRGRTGYHRGRDLTTALCARALAAALRAGRSG
jgi:hypothetical protein